MTDSSTDPAWLKAGVLSYFGLIFGTVVFVALVMMISDLLSPGAFVVVLAVGALALLFYKPMKESGDIEDPYQRLKDEREE